MITVEVHRDPAGKVSEFRARFAVEPRELTASVSVLLRTAVLGLERYLRLEPEVEEGEGSFRCRLERESFLSREIDAILETMVLGLRELEREHPEELEVQELTSDVRV